MIDVLAGAVKVAQADTTLMALFPASSVMYLDNIPEPQKTYPRAVVRHVRSTWKYTQPSKIDQKRLRDDTTVFRFEVWADDLPTLNQIQLRLRTIFDTKPFALIAYNGSTVSTDTASMTSCLEEVGGTIQSMPQPNQSQLSIHRLDIRFRCEISRYF